jgi:glycosyltransferase involved in cell wall biosynthesis
MQTELPYDRIEVPKAPGFAEGGIVSNPARTTSTRMRGATRILYICSSWPAGSSFGGQLRTIQIGRALKHVGQITLAVVGSEAGNQALGELARKEFNVALTIEPNLSVKSGLIVKGRRFADAHFMDLHGVQASGPEREKVLSLCAEHDLVWVNNARTPNILRIWSWPKAHLDLDDIPSTYVRAVSAVGGTVGARLRQRWMRHRELLWKERFPTLSVCSQSDREYLGGGDNIHVIPNGFEQPSGEPIRIPEQEPPRIGFIGLCTYEPNRDGVRWFLENCWNSIRRQIPGIRFRLAGKGSEEFATAGYSDLDILGWIPDAAAEIATWSGMVIPIRFGGGTRVKLADAFSRKCPVVSTSMGAYGYDVADHRELLIADEAADFANACISLVRDKYGSEQMAQRAHAAYLEKWTWDAIAPRVWEAAEACLSRPAP